MKKIFKLSNLIPLLLVVYIAKSFIQGPSFFDFGIISIMSVLFIKKLSMDNESISNKEELIAIISQLEEEVNKKIGEIERIQRDDRLAAEGKFSTLNLGVQRQSTSKSKDKFGWGQ